MIHSARFVAILDACVLYPAPIRDLLLYRCFAAMRLLLGCDSLPRQNVLHENAARHKISVTSGTKWIAKMPLGM